MRYGIALEVSVIIPTTEVIIITRRRTKRNRACFDGVFLGGSFHINTTIQLVCNIVNYGAEYRFKLNVARYDIRERNKLTVNRPTVETISRLFTHGCRNGVSFLDSQGVKRSSPMRIKAYGIRRQSTHSNGIKLHCVSVRNENIEGIIAYADSCGFAWYRLCTVNVASYYINCAIIYSNIVKEREYRRCVGN